MRRITIRLLLAALAVFTLFLWETGGSSALASGPGTMPVEAVGAATHPALGTAVVPGSRVTVMPYAFASTKTGPVSSAKTLSKNLTYYGGRVVSNLQVVNVLWGSGTFAPYVSSTGAGTNAAFLSGVLNSPYLAWLDNDYNTVTHNYKKHHSNQHIGYGTFFEQVQITPSQADSATNGSCGPQTVTDSQIQAEISAQIAAGTLPAPTHDAGGNDNTEYVVYFPAGTSISDTGSTGYYSGCSMTNGFCAYHGTIGNVPGYGEAYYAVMPDFTGVTGCGTSATEYDNETSVLSHELVETITDPEVGIATTTAPPLAWYSNTYGEIGDICNGQQAAITGTDNVTYSVQKQWSNSTQTCRAT